MSLQPPREPIILGFHPENSEDSGVVMVFRDDIARSLWLMIRVNHLIGPHFTEYCIRTAELVRKMNPKGPKELHDLIQGVGGIEGNFFPGLYNEYEAFMVRLFDAVKGRRTIAFRTIRKGSSEDIARKRRIRRCAFWHGLIGKEPKVGMGFSYLCGYRRGVRLRRRIKESSEPSIKYG